MVAHSKPRVCRVVKVGTDFTGMNSTSVALGRILPNKFNVVFSSEIQPECVALQKVMEAGQRIVKYGDVTKRSIDAMPYSDVYVWTPPCQSFSAAGKRKGAHDARGKLLAVGVKYTVAKMPRVAIMENVKGLMSPRHRPVVKGVSKALTDAGYQVHWKVLNARDFHLAQARLRVVMVAIRNDCVSKDRPFTWPTATRGATLKQILDPVKASDKRGRMPTFATGKTNMKAGMKKARAAGINPLKVPCAIDIDSSLRYFTMGINHAKTLTRSRGASMGPWITTRGRRCSISELLKLQGFKDEDVPWEEARLTPKQVGAMLGNAVPVPMIGEVMSHAMYSAGVISADTFMVKSSLI